MYQIHKIIAGIVFIACWTLAYWLEPKISEAYTQNLITFFSITLGFYMTSISVLYSSQYTKDLYKIEDDKKKGQTKLHTLKKYYIASCAWSIFCVVATLIFMLAATASDNGELAITDGLLLSIWKVTLQKQAFWIASLLACSAVNILFLWLVLKVFLSGLVEESRKS